MLGQFLERAGIRMPDIKSQFVPKGKLYEPALRAETAGELRAVLRKDIGKRARVRDDEKFPFDPKAPLIVYEAMNRRPEAGVAVLLGRLAKLELGREDGTGLVIIGTPRSASWTGRVVEGAQIFAKARLTQVTKDLASVPVYSSYCEVPVSSYTRGRHAPAGSQGGTSGLEIMYVVNPDQIKGKDVLLLDDMVAEGVTAITLAQAMKEDLGARRVEVAVVMSKLMQGGSDRIRESGFVDGLVEGVRIAEVLGPGYGQLVFK